MMRPPRCGTDEATRDHPRGGSMHGIGQETGHATGGSRRAVVLIVMLAVVGLVPVIAGCAGRAAPDGVPVRGRVVRDGQPLPLDERLAAAAAAYVRVGFQRLEADGGLGNGTAVLAAPDGTFAVPALPPGRYRVSVEHCDGHTNDLLGGRFDSDRSALEIEVGDTPITDHVIDVGGGS